MRGRIDETDYNIVNLLRRDGRISSTTIARDLKISEKTVRNRITRMGNDGILSIVAILDRAKLGYMAKAHVEVETEPLRVKDVAQLLAQMPEARWVSIVTGEYDILVSLCCKSNEGIFEFVTEKLAPIPGVRRTRTIMIVDELKHVEDWMPELEN
jgi:Lrp/AsnC family transcriptional regulator for asnA, asnC and gidA